MTQIITVSLPNDIQIALDEASRTEGVSREELVGRAVKQHLFLRRFRSLRDRLSEKAANPSDEDVFDRVS